MDGEPPRDVMTAADAARVLGISKQRVSVLVREGKLPAFRDRTHLWIDAAAVRERAVEEQHYVPPGRLTVKQVAELLGVREATVRHYHRSGLLHGGVKDRNILTFPGDVLDGFVRPLVGVPRRKQPYNAAFRRPKS